ncbi:MAG: haloacid dehalogenase [Desulfobacterales bacterium]|nr:haloacid dehalogenase [Desulfobacterales bacterium]
MTDGKSQITIDPALLAFDIDGVVADTMNLFLDIARDEYHINNIKYEDISRYILEECLDIDTKIIDEIIVKLIDGAYTQRLKPIDGSVDVLTKLAGNHSPLTFVTARPYLEPIYDWIVNILPVEKAAIDVVATGHFEAKLDVLQSKNISYFVEDRLDTCFLLKDAGITPVIYKQPWNRENHPFVEVGNWGELESLIKF